MLDARLKRGWKPTASALKDGDRILGHACKLTLPSTELGP